MDRIGIDGACTSAIAAALCGEMTRGNDEVIDATRRFPGRLFGYITVNPNRPSIAEEVERCAAAGLRALKIHNYHGKAYDAQEYRPAYEIAQANGWPILAHTGDQAHVLDELAGEYSNVTWLLAHAAGAEPWDLCEIARGRENVVLETCASPCPYRVIETLVEGASADKVLFGSDMTFLNATNQIGKILFSRVSDADKEKILGLNARRVFALK
jgi:predicted TIM-barrel fold metal-dependent hydrolase